MIEVATPSHSVDVFANGQRVGSITAKLEIHFDNTITDDVAHEIIECVTVNHLHDTLSDYAIEVGRATRDGEVNQTDDPTDYTRTVTERFGEGSFTLTLEASLQLDIPVSNHRNTCDIIEAKIITHLEAHMSDPSHDKIRESLDADKERPDLHITSTIKGIPIRKLIAQHLPECAIARRLVDEVFPEEALPFSEILRYASNGANNQVIITLNETEHTEHTGQGLYL